MASPPLFPALVPARSTACSVVSVVRIPKATGTPAAAATYADTVDAFAALPSWDAESLKAALEAVGERHELKLGKAQAGVRVAVTGRSVGPPLFESIELLGSVETLRRLRSREVAAG